jgi:formamidopyrimidine-DNA glycosylase
MPEGHTIHRLAKDHTAHFVGRSVRLTSPQGRFADGARLLDGRALLRVEPYGKHLFYDFGAERVLHVHLGLYGSFTPGSQPAPEPRGLVRLRLETSETYVDLRGPTACELLDPAGVARVRDRLGPDPLRRDGAATEFARRLLRRSTPLGAALMDQAVVAGVGNVYRAESLFLLRLSPFVPARSIGEQHALAAWALLQRLLRAGVRAGRIVTTDPAHRARRSGPARADDAHYVYRRTGLQCRVCATPVRTEVMAGRNLHWCPGCQSGSDG